MIVYGWRQVQTGKEDISETCPDCKTSMSLTLYVFHKYIHIFWIPLFPIGRKVKSHCASCDVVIEKKYMPESLKFAYSNMKGKRIPIWMFSGVIIIFAIIGWSFINSAIQEHGNKSMISSPLKDDVYEVKLDYEKYTSYKVKNVTKDSVYFLMNNYTTDQTSGLDDLKKMEYNDTAFVVSKPQLEEMFQKGDIIGIDRN